MYEAALFVLDKNVNEHNKEEIEKIRDVLKSVGIEIKISEDQDRDYLYINVTNEFTEKKTRNAGRKNKSIKGWVKIEDVEKMISEKTADVVAKEFGIGRATLFRKLKKAKEEGDEYLY